MTAAFFARAIVSAIAAGQGIMPVFIDLNHTHATNPLWPGHARFHLVQQVFTLLPAAAIELALLWCPGVAFHARFYLAALLTGTSLAGFLVAVCARPLYGGTLHDPNGMRPVRLRIGSRLAVFDLNVPIVLLASVLLLTAVLLYWLRA
ncbi:MAG TPA: hypothetical protein VGG94_03325 [Chthoniobacterales bacterium]|jgi:hypothetical protein